MLSVVYIVYCLLVNLTVFREYSGYYLNFYGYDYDVMVELVYLFIHIQMRME